MSKSYLSDSDRRPMSGLDDKRHTSVSPLRLSRGTQPMLRERSVVRKPQPTIPLRRKPNVARKPLKHYGSVARGERKRSAEGVAAKLKTLMGTLSQSSDEKYIPGSLLVNESVMEPLGEEASNELSVAASMLSSPLHSYMFELHGYSTLTSSGAGNLNTFLPFDPSGSGFSFSEWSTLASLFSEYRLKSFHVQFVGAFNTGIGQLPLAIASNIGVASAPGSTAVVIQNADAVFWSAQHDTSRLGYTHHVRITDLGWAATASPTSTPYAGAPGSIQIYADFQGATVNIARALVRGVYEFRTRQ